MIAIKYRAASALKYWARTCFHSDIRTFSCFVRSTACLGLWLSCVALQATAAGTTPAATTTSIWTCQAFYLPARSIWQRTVAIDYDGAVIRSVWIDGVAVYTFSINGTSVMTAVDGERIQFDVAALTWTSDLRGLVSSAGRCEP